MNATSQGMWGIQRPFLKAEEHRAVLNNESLAPFPSFPRSSVGVGPAFFTLLGYLFYLHVAL
jgi:hypothetical protein